jgi:hypothetical protein
MRMGGDLKGRVSSAGRVAGIGVLGVAGAVGGGLVFSQTAFATVTGSQHKTGNTVSCTTSSGLVHNGTVKSDHSTAGDYDNPLGNTVLICATKANGQVTGGHSITFKVWQVVGGSSQSTSVNGYVVLHLRGGSTVKIYVEPPTVTAQGASNAKSVTIKVPSTVGSKVSVTGGYFKGEVSSSSSNEIKLEYKIKSGATSNLSVTGHAWIDPPTPLGSPIAPLFGNDGLEIVGLIGIASAATAAVVIRRRQLARNSAHE